MRIVPTFQGDKYFSKGIISSTCHSQKQRSGVEQRPFLPLTFRLTTKHEAEPVSYMNSAAENMVTRWKTSYGQSRDQQRADSHRPCCGSTFEAASTLEPPENFVPKTRFQRNHGQNIDGCSAAQVLHSWKDISSFVGRGIRTVRRWEHDLGLPVHRAGDHECSAPLLLSLKRSSSGCIPHQLACGQNPLCPAAKRGRESRTGGR